MALGTSCGIVITNHPEPRLQHLAHGVDPGAQGRIDQVGIALGGADLGVAEEAADRFQRGAAGNQQRCEGVARAASAEFYDI